MRLRYELEKSGWATVTLELGGTSIQMTASYLHDSLRDLASAARALAMGAAEVRVMFMDEPGEHELILRQAADGVDVQVLWYADWKSWGMSSEPGEERIHAHTSLAHVRGQVLSELRRLLAEHGEEGYKARWIEHSFPITELHDLEAAHGGS